MNLTEVGWEGVDKIHLADCNEDLVSIKVGEFLD
jgi:hypothetical protein